MKKILGLSAAILFLAPAVFAAVVEDWTGVQAGTNTGTYMDSTGTKIDFSTDAGPKSGQKALKLTVNLVQGGYCGIWHNIAADMSKAGSLKFMAKSTVPGDVQIALMDAYKVQYIAKASVGADWAEVSIPFSSFSKDPSYTPADAVTGHAMDLSKTTGMNVAPQMVGSAVVMVGPVETDGTAAAAPAASTSSSPAKETMMDAKPAASTGAVAVLDCTDLDGKSAGTFQDSQGSAFAFTTKDVADKKDKKYLSVTYTLVQGGYAGMWVRAGDTSWSGVDLSGAKSLDLMVYSKEPLVLGIALKDKNNNQYVAETPSTKGGKWETVSIPMASFKLDPYYTSPDGVKGAPMDLSKVGTFNIQPKTVGKFTFAVNSIIGK